MAVGSQRLEVQETLALEQFVAKIVERLEVIDRDPLLIAIDGELGAAHSLVAAALAPVVDAVLVSVIDFMASDVTDDEWADLNEAAKIDRCVDWPRLRKQAVVPLLAGMSARWQAVDVVSSSVDGTYGLRVEPVVRQPGPVIILVGPLANHPAIRDLVDVPLLVEGTQLDASYQATWEKRVVEVSEKYFTDPSVYDLVVSTD